MAGYTKMVYPEMVTHPSINRARRRVTSLIESNMLPLSQVTSIMVYLISRYQSPTTAGYDIIE